MEEDSHREEFATPTPNLEPFNTNKESQNKETSSTTTTQLKIRYIPRSLGGFNQHGHFLNRRLGASIFAYQIFEGYETGYLSQGMARKEMVILVLENNKLRLRMWTVNGAVTCFVLGIIDYFEECSQPQD
ncbi:hypothetical protein VNO78_10261 [Psophocarpus tetragonolobus]|uniref:Uncharacterized protein n=1 Tax=Psophocarpus tetragonolobus TaxID=3891 RepID=A0AAN9XMD9_PSOTE